ncbi:MAG: DNA polymerase III subunit alpha [Bacteriovoracia bacterium]
MEKPKESSAHTAPATPGPGFVHLHMHTQYSLLQGAIRVKPLFEKVKSLGMPAVAITDTNNLFGAIDFYFTAKEYGIKAIIGCEVLYHAEGHFGGEAAALSPADRLKPRFHHLVLLCKDQAGYQNLCQLVTHAYTDMPPPKKGQKAPLPLVSQKLLDQFGDGLVVLSGCLRGELAYKILQGDEEGAEKIVKWFKQRFGADFYLELQDNGLPEQTQTNDILYHFGKKFGIACVATNDCHYLNPEDAEAHEVLQCIMNGRNLDFDRPKSLVPSEYHVKSAAEMHARFERFPGVCEASLEIAEKCDLKFKFKDAEGRPIYHLPSFRPDGIVPGSAEDKAFDIGKYFAEESLKGLEARLLEPQFLEKKKATDWAEKEKIYRKRLKDEVEMIQRTGFAGYFLIVADFIGYAKKNQIPVGPGRGSGAGSLVAYSLFITDIDPIEFNLLFERFINPERISLPDFDVDFCQDRRGEVIDYVNRKYGAQNVCQIITFGKLQARAVIKDVARVLGLTFAESDQITKLLPDELNIKLTDAIEKEPLLRDRMNADAKLAKVMEYALALEGLSRNAGVHAAGVIITEKPVVSYCPLYMGSEGAPVCQFDKDFAEKIGLVKFDFLGLKTLTVIDNAIRLVREVSAPAEPAVEVRLERINYRDPKVYELISAADTDGVFQVESSGMKDLCARLQPNSVEDLTAINALFRPGPLGSGMVDDFIDCKHGRKQIVYEVPELAPILKDTYGVILYQEQVMQIAREMAGYSLGQADMLRRAMGKKKADEMAKHRDMFVKGAIERKFDQKKAETIFDLMAKFAEYGFNKSHSAAYAVLTYQTAYLKTYYPAEFMAALMTTELNSTDKITKYISDARAHQIPILPPDVNRSKKHFSVEVLTPDHDEYPKALRGTGKPIKAIRFGLEAIKGVGGIAVDSILNARTTKDFKDVADFCKRVEVRKVNKKVLEALTLSGALDRISPVNRASLFSSLEGLLETAADEQAERELGQSSLFDSFNAEDIKLVQPTSLIFKQEPDWPLAKKLLNEKQVVGFYVSGHPMDHWQTICEEWLGWSTEKLQAWGEQKALQPQAPASTPTFGKGGFQRPQRKEIRIAGLMTESKEITTKKGTRMAFAQLEDLKGKVEIIFFPDAYASLADKLKLALGEAEPVIITGELEYRDGTVKILAKAIEKASEVLNDNQQGKFSRVIVSLNSTGISVEQLRELKKHLIEHRGKCPVAIEFAGESSGRKFRTRLDLPGDLKVATSPAMVAAVNKIFGASVVSLRE